jgi:two-component system, response regulator PdtaR
MLILIAEDESVIRLGLKAMLQEMGHEVVMAVNGREALEQARRQQPDLAILDIKMPLTNGLQVAETLSRTRPLPILLLTAFSEKDLIEKASELPIHGYLIKPIQSAELAAAIAVAQKRFAERQALLAQTAQLEESLATRKLLDRAKSQLMAGGMSESEAHQSLQQQARQNRQSLRQVCEQLLRRRGDGRDAEPGGQENE